MTSFRTIADPKNSNAHFIKEWSKPSEWFLASDQGIHLCKKHLFEGDFRLQHVLEAKPGAKIALDGLLEVHESYLRRSKDGLDAILDCSYTFVDSTSDEEIVSVFFKWNQNSKTRVWSVAFAHESRHIDAYFHGIKFTSTKQIEFVLQDFEFFLPVTTNLALFETGYTKVKPFDKPIVHVETDWDLT